MFGYVVANKPELKFREFDVYRSYYCGLCHSLKSRHGLSGQLTLSYDMTFLVMLLSSLYEPDLHEYSKRCVIHPIKHQHIIHSEYSDYVADMNVILSYYKCLDDWNDDKNILKLAYSKLLKNGTNFYIEKSGAISSLLDELGTREKMNETNIDVVAGLFGKIMEILFVPKKDIYSDGLGRMGFFLGKFIYIMDAFDDVKDDVKKGRYNIFSNHYKEPDFKKKVKDMLTMMIAECCDAFEMLPIVDNADILRNILYSGVWSSYERRIAKNLEKEN